MTLLRRVFLVILIASFSVSVSGASETETQWQKKIYDDVNRLFKPVAEAAGMTFLLETNWQSSSVTASAMSDGKVMRIFVDGGMLRSPRLSEDGLPVILCHEAGHLLGGAPRRAPPLDWDGLIASDGLMVMSSEGQADFYATVVCFRKLVRGQNHPAFLKLGVPPAVKRACSSLPPQESLVCQRAALGGYNMLQLTFTFKIDFATPDLDVAPKLISDSYPSRQCRLDTFLAGARFSADLALFMNPLDATQNGCIGSLVSERPACWYR